MKEKILLVTKKCTCGKEEHKFFVMAPITVDHPLVCSTFISRLLNDNTVLCPSTTIEQQVVDVDVCSRCVGSRDVFAEREERKLIADDIAEFIEERETWEYGL